MVPVPPWPILMRLHAIVHVNPQEQWPHSKGWQGQVDHIHSSERGLHLEKG